MPTIALPDTDWVLAVTSRSTIALSGQGASTRSATSANDRLPSTISGPAYGRRDTSTQWIGLYCNDFDPESRIGVAGGEKKGSDGLKRGSGAKMHPTFM